MASLILDRLRSNDGFTKLKLVYAPTEIYHTLDELVGALGANHTVTHVLLEGAFCRELCTEDFPVLLTAIGKLQALSDLEIWSSPVPVAALCNAIQPALRLKRLGLGLVTLSGDMNADSLKEHPSLRTFCLSDFSLARSRDRSGSSNNSSSSTNTPMRLDSLLRALATCPALDTVEIFSNRSSAVTGVPWSPSSLAALMYATPHLTLRRLSLTVEAVRILPVHLQKQQRARQQKQQGNPKQQKPTNWSPRLRVLNLNENQLRDVGCVALVRALTEHGFPVKELNLRANEITSEGCRGMVQQLLQSSSSSVSAVPSTTTTSSPTISTSSTVMSTTLEKLNLSCNELSDESAPALVDLIEQHASIKRMELYRTNLTDVGCTLLAQAVANNRLLLSLGLGRNQMTDMSYIAWAAALSVNQTLESISLQEVDHKQITTVGAQAMLDMIRDNYCLEHIGMNLSDRFGMSLSDRSSTNGKSWFHTRINMFLRLNHAGRKRLLQGAAPSRRDWLQTVEAVHDDLNAIRYLVQSNPTLWLSNSSR
jgi:Ran GTPase-activating protein (RanGAP) involved in mRNA processing and transport